MNHIYKRVHFREDKVMTKTWQFLKDAWCYIAHPDPMWPVNGYYRCPSCQRTYPVPWEQGGATRWNRHQTETTSTATPRRVADPTLEY